MKRRILEYRSKNIFKLIGKPLFVALFSFARTIVGLGAARTKAHIKQAIANDHTTYIRSKQVTQNFLRASRTAGRKVLSTTMRRGALFLSPKPTQVFAKRKPQTTSLPFSRASQFVTQVIRSMATTFFALRAVILLSLRVVQRVGRMLLRGSRVVASSPFWTSRFMRIFHKVWLPIATCILVFLIGFHTALQFYGKYLDGIPTPQDLRTHVPALTTRIYDRNGILLYSMYKDENRSLVQLSELPAHLKDAFVSIEDKEFYEHHGISFRGMARAARIFFFEPWETMQGGSTITQQVIKNTLLSNERTFDRKIKEIFIALQVERQFSKDEILELYLNEVPFGGSLYGVEEASKAYFNKSAKDLSLPEAAFIAGLPAAPSIYTPFGSYPERGIARQHEVLRRMLEDEKISPEIFEQAKAEKLAFVQTKHDLKAPHFVMFVREQLAKEYGEERLAQGGLEITTTLDLSLQDKVQDIVSKEVDSLKQLHINNGAALVTDPRTGEILAMVGSKNYYDTKNDGQVNVTIRERQPGSAIKPLTYAAAFERGFTPSTIIEDKPLTVAIAGSKPYSPQNYDGSYHGNVTVRRALACSYNIPAVKTLMNIGVGNLIEKAKIMGITTWTNTNRYGLSLTLGGGDIKMTDMATAYSTFANNGQTVPLKFISEIKDHTGNTLVQNPCIGSLVPCGGKRTLDSRIAYQITSILSDNAARAPAFGLNSVLAIKGHEVAVKTGTTNNRRDNWTFGYTSDRLIATWVGNNDNSPMSYVASGVVGASPIWAMIMQEILPKETAHRFPVPQGLIAVEVCAGSGMASCGLCGTKYTEYFLPGTEPASECSTIAQKRTPSPAPTPRNQRNQPTRRDNRREQRVQAN